MIQNEFSITGEPISNAICRFTVDRPVYPDKSFSFGSKEAAQGSPLPERIFEIEGVKAVVVSHDQVTVTKTSNVEWPLIGRQIGNAIRAHLAAGQPPVSESVWDKIPPAHEIRERVQYVFDTEINPAVASHGGIVNLIDVKDNVVYIQMGGGCQGCGQANVTLKHGVETAIRAAIPEVGDILDVTDHAAGRNPYYTPSMK
jgi:Fe-S cluster biogenesis protein NfuA